MMLGLNNDCNDDDDDEHDDDDDDDGDGDAVDVDGDGDADDDDEDGGRTEDGGGMPRQRRHASPEGLRSEKDAVSIVKHNENEKSAKKRLNSEGKLTFPIFDFHFHCVFTVNIFAT